jgi:hypothetical protein
MTKKDYTKIAALIKRFREMNVKSAVRRGPISGRRAAIARFHFDEFADEMTDLFAEDSEIFNREKFLKACGMEGGL